MVSLYSVLYELKHVIWIAAGHIHPLPAPCPTHSICSSGNALDERKLKQHGGLNCCQLTVAGLTPEADEQVEKLRRILWHSALRRKWHDAPQRNWGRFLRDLSLAESLFSARHSSPSVADQRLLSALSFDDAHMWSADIQSLFYSKVQPFTNSPGCSVDHVKRALMLRDNKSKAIDYHKNVMI